jgi:hypothetical protein
MFSPSGIERVITGPPRPHPGIPEFRFANSAGPARMRQPEVEKQNPFPPPQTVTCALVAGNLPASLPDTVAAVRHFDIALVFKR